MEIITRINREKGFEYKVDKDGNVVRENYNLLKDKWTLVVLCILILAGAYYFQAQSSRANVNNLDNTCQIYLQFKERWITENPGQVPIAKDILNTAIENNWKIDSYNPIGK